MKARPKWRKSPPELIGRFDCLLAAMPDTERRQMFGYPAAFATGRMYASLFPESMVLPLT